MNGEQIQEEMWTIIKSATNRKPTKCENKHAPLFFLTLVVFW